jgi:transposase
MLPREVNYSQSSGTTVGHNSVNPPHPFLRLSLFIGYDIKTRMQDGPRLLTFEDKWGSSHTVWSFDPMASRVTDEDIRRTVKELDERIKKEYVEIHPERGEEKRDWRTYEQRFSRRIRDAIKALDPLIREAVSTIRIEPRTGRPDSLSLEQRVKLLLIKQLVGESNRMFANMLDVFSMLSGIEVSYKTVERLYSDEEVMMALHNLQVLMLKKKGIQTSDATGDGTGYSLTISRHYESAARELKDKAKENGDGGAGGSSSSPPTPTPTEGPKKRAFAFSFRLMDLSTRMYLAYGSSLRSEKEAYGRAMGMLSTLDVTLASVRLDRYYSTPGYVDSLGETRVFVIPKSNATLNGSWRWKETMIRFVKDPLGYLEEYHKRSNSEAGFSADKKMLGWSIAQRREDRIDCANACTGLWHNLFNLAPL